MKKILIHFLLLIVFARSQAQKINEVYGFLLGGVSFPGSSFRQAYNNNMGGIGLAGNAGFVVNPFALGNNKRYSPVLIGIDLGWNYLGRDKFEYNNAPYLKTEFWTGNYGLLLRLDPPFRKRFSLFADAFAGWGRYWANTKIDKTFAQSILDNNQYLVGKYNDNNFTTGLGAGIIIRAKSPDEPSFTLRGMYYFNGEYRAVVRNSIMVSGNTLSYNVRNVNANMFIIQAGVSIF